MPLEEGRGLGTAINEQGKSLILGNTWGKPSDTSLMVSSQVMDSFFRFAYHGIRQWEA